MDEDGLGWGVQRAAFALSAFIRVHLIRFAHPCGAAFGSLSPFGRLWFNFFGFYGSERWSR